MPYESVLPDKPDRVRETLDLIVQRFVAGDVAEAIAKVSFPASDVPMSRWSLNNRFMAAMAGTVDARGFNQWKEVKRSVTKGRKAFFILAPSFAPDDRAEPNGEGDRPMRLVGFRAVPVFRVEDTEGEPLDYQQLQVPEHPLLDVAKAWGLTIHAVPANGMFYGSYCPGRNQILLATPDEQTFFHELAHAADEKVHGPLQNGQRPDQEIVAQLSAEVLAEMVGRQMGNIGYSYLRISAYAEEWFPKVDQQEAIRRACHQVLRRTCQVIEAILKVANEKKEDPCPTPDPPRPCSPAIPALPAEEPVSSAAAPSTGITIAPPGCAPVQGAPSTVTSPAPAVAEPGCTATSSCSTTETTLAIPISEISLPCEPVCRQITISGMQLKQTLAALKPHVDSPWSNVRLSGKKGGLVIEAIGVKTLVATRVTLNGEGEAGFDLHLPLRDLLGVVQSVKKKERVTLALENQGLRLGLEAMSTVLSPVLNPDDAPVYPSMAEQSERIATLPLDASAFEYTLAAMSTDYSRPNIEVLHFEPEADDKPAFVVSTDGHRLHEADLPGATICKPFSLWGAAAELVQRLQKATGDTQAEAYRDDKGVMQVQAPGWEIRCTAEEHLFPDFRRVLPSRSLLPISVTIPLEPFRKALKAMKKVAVVEVNVNGAIDLTWSDRSSGSSGKATLPQLDHIGPDVIGGFNPSYMLAAFETESERGIWQFPALTKDAEGVTISEGVLGPTLFRSEAGDRRAVLMPCRL